MSELSEKELRRRRVIAAAYAEDEDWRRRNRGSAPSENRKSAESKKVVSRSPLQPSPVPKIQPVIIAVRNLKIGDRQLSFGQEVPPDLLSDSETEKRLDCGDLALCKTRRSLVRMLHKFSGAAFGEYWEDHRQFRL